MNCYFIILCEFSEDPMKTVWFRERLDFVLILCWLRYAEYINKFWWNDLPEAEDAMEGWKLQSGQTGVQKQTHF